MPRPRKDEPSKLEPILEIAQRLIQQRGYNGFSFREVASEVGCTSASIHYHFPTKGDLARAVAARYREAFASRLNDLSAVPETSERLYGFARLFLETLENDRRLCLCGILASESESLPPEVLAEAEAFFAETEAWLSKTLGDARPAKSFLAAMEGALLVARARNRPREIDEVAAHLVPLITT
ncbi:MAG: TetR/AcrR family transcriptional regulator [Acidobacteriota bacterium]